MINSRSAWNRIYYVVGKHVAYPGRSMLMRAWLIVKHDKTVVWCTRIADDKPGTPEEISKVAERTNFSLDQPTLIGITNGSPLTFEQVRILEGYRQIDRRKLRISKETILYGKGKRRA